MQSENTAAAYKDESSDSENHDAYLERMKAEGEDKDSEDGTHPHNTIHTTQYTHVYMYFALWLLWLLWLSFFFAEDSDFVAPKSGSDDDLE